VTSIDFTGQTVLITGGTRGIGAAIAKEFHDAGANLILTGDNQAEIDQCIESDLSAGLEGIEYMQVEFTNDDSLDGFFKKIAKLSRLDVLVNNAGTNRNNPIDEIKTEDIDLLHAVNLRAHFLLTREVAKLMKAAKSGKIVSIASIWGVISRERRAAYSATKWGIIGLTKAVAADLGPYNVLVNAVSPGFTLTELTKATLSQEEYDSLSAQVPLRRFATPDEIARIVMFLASPLNTYITGQNIVVDGGFVSV